MLDWHSCQMCYPLEIKLLLSLLLLLRWKMMKSNIKVEKMSFFTRLNSPQIGKHTHSG